jgi:hypothetical protein
LKEKSNKIRQKISEVGMAHSPFMPFGFQLPVVADQKKNKTKKIEKKKF